MSSILNYKLTEEDFLEFQIYFSIGSKNQRSQRTKTRIVTALIIGAIGYYFLTIDSTVMAYTYFAAGALLFAFYHRYSYWRYKRHFTKHIREHRKGMIGPEFSLEIADGQIISTSEAGDGNLKPSAIEKLVELENIYIITFMQSQSIIVPKRNVLSGFPKEVMEELTQTTSLPITDCRQIKWK